jgi:hypothetical protein
MFFPFCLEARDGRRSHRWLLPSGLLWRVRVSLCKTRTFSNSFLLACARNVVQAFCPNFATTVASWYSLSTYFVTITHAHHPPYFSGTR